MEAWNDPLKLMAVAQRGFDEASAYGDDVRRPLERLYAHYWWRACGMLAAERETVRGEA